MTEKRFLLPDDPNEQDTICIQFNVPNDLGYLTAFWGAVGELGFWNSWERDPQKQATVVASRWRQIIKDARNSDCAGGPMNFSFQQQGCDIVLLVDGFEAARLTLDGSLCPALVGPPGPQGPQGIQGPPGEDGTDGLAGDYIKDIIMVDGVLRKIDQDDNTVDVVDFCDDPCHWTCEYLFATMNDLKPWVLTYGDWPGNLKMHLYYDALGVWSAQLLAYIQMNDTFNVSEIEVDVFLPYGDFGPHITIIIRDGDGHQIHFEYLNPTGFSQPMQFTIKEQIPEMWQDLDFLAVDIIQENSGNGQDDWAELYIEAIRLKGSYPRPRYDDGQIDRLICPES